MVLLDSYVKQHQCTPCHYSSMVILVPAWWCWETNLVQGIPRTFIVLTYSFKKIATGHYRLSYKLISHLNILVFVEGKNCHLFF